MIIIPMMGRSSRFFDAGYKIPKYELPLAGKTVLDWVLQSFEPYFDIETFVFVVRRDFKGKTAVQKALQRSRIAKYEILEFDQETRGQADTVYKALKALCLEESSIPLAIFNADSFLPSFEMPDLSDSDAGVIDVFQGEGDHWSFIEPGPSNTVLKTTEKERISDYCSNGFYYFRSCSIFVEAFICARGETSPLNAELYVAPLYNCLIAKGHQIRYRLQPREFNVFCGTPMEYESLNALGWPGFSNQISPQQ
ncbi:NTP transferase domain-containing protein [Corynebacterium dentalis]|uniref:NTP transferase domain-containing protein n=1 Tax=Corynebacterium dentalis TaxID=2014528 RepID=UPI000C07300C|nr:NTP transferase domain-containing protein [Corynebacterium dentalis]